MTDPSFGRSGPLPLGVLLDEAMRHWRRHFRVIYWRVALPIAVGATLIGVAQALWYSSLMEDLGAMPSPFLVPQLFLLVLAYMLLLMVAYNAMQVAALDVLSGRPIDMRRAWRFALQPRALGTLALWYICALAALACCLLPALYVWPLLAFVAPAMIEEGRFGTSALSRSAELTRYNPGRQWGDSPLFKVFLLFLVGFLVSYLLGLLVALPFQIPMYVDMFRQAATGEDFIQRMPFYMWLQVPAQFLNGLASTAVYLYLCFGTAMLFFDTRGRKEGVDLRSDIDDVFGGPPAVPEPPYPGEPTS